MTLFANEQKIGKTDPANSGKILNNFSKEVTEAMLAGRRPRAPECREEFLILEELSPRLARHFRPAQPWLTVIGLPHDYGFPAEHVPPFDRWFRRRLIESARIDPNFAEALARILGVLP